MLEYDIKASVLNGGKATATANHSEIAFDATSGRDNILPNPAELLLTSLAACMLKNVQRYSEILNIPYKKASISIHGKRNDNPPFISEVSYTLELETDVDEKNLATLHKNILRFGTITNTLAKACKLKGELIKCQSR